VINHFLRNPERRDRELSTKNRSVYTEGNLLKSYGDHYVVAKTYTEEMRDGYEPVILVNEGNSSRTTNNICLQVKNGLEGGAFASGGLQIGFHHNAGVEVYYPDNPVFSRARIISGIEDKLGAMMRARNTHMVLSMQIIRDAVRAAKLSDWFNLGTLPVKYPDGFKHWAVKQRLKSGFILPTQISDLNDYILNFDEQSPTEVWDIFYDPSYEQTRKAS
jgi:hypothetical protein